MQLPPTVEPAQRQQLCAIYALQLLIEETGEFPFPLEPQQAFLSPVFAWMVSSQYVQVENHAYLPTQRGKDVLAHFLQRYQHFLSEMDVYCAVDLAEGEFAFSSFDRFSTQPAWETFLAQERWADVRVALCEWQGKDPIEAVFMNFIEQGSFGLARNGWDYDAFLGDVWEEIANLAHGALHLQDLAYESQGEFFPAAQVAKDIYEQGQQIR